MTDLVDQFYSKATITSDFFYVFGSISLHLRNQSPDKEPGLLILINIKSAGVFGLSKE